MPQCRRSASGPGQPPWKHIHALHGRLTFQAVPPGRVPARDKSSGPQSSIGKMVRAKSGPKLPVVLTTEEVRKILDYLEEKDLLLVQVLYGTGMRLMELARPRIYTDGA